MQILIITLVLVITSFASYLLRHQTVSRYSVYVIAGIALANFVEINQILDLATFGAIFIIFYLSLRANPKIFKEEMGITLKTVLATLLIVVAPLYVFFSYQGFMVIESTLLSLAIATGSSLVGLKLVKKEIARGLKQGKLTESINLLHDFLILIVLAVFSSPIKPLQDIVLIVFLGVLVYSIKDVFAKTFLKITGNSNELQLLIAVTILLGFSALTQYIGIGILTGAFLAGMLFSNHKTSYEIRKNVQPLEEFFIVILFVSIGISLGIPSFNSVLLALALVFLTFISVMIHQIILTKQHIHPKTSFYTAIQMDQVSEFIVIAALFLYLANTISLFVYEAIAIAFLITSITSLLTDTYKEKIFQIFNLESYVMAQNIPKKNHVIVAGVGNIAKKLYDDLQKNEVKLLGIDKDPQKVEDLKHYLIANLHKKETWEQANAKDAKAIILFDKTHCQYVKDVKAKKFLVSTDAVKGFIHIDVNKAEEKMFAKLLEKILKA